MQTSNSPPFFSALIICVLASLVTSGSVAAIGIGELSLASKLGQPLYATVDTQLAKGESIEDACLSIVAVEESSSALVQTGLSIRFNWASHKIEIRSKRPFNEPYAAFGLHIQCKGSSNSTSKVFAVLPEFESNPAPAPIVAPKIKLIVASAPKVEVITPPIQSEQTKQLENTPLAVEPAPTTKPTPKNQAAPARVKATSVQGKSEFRLQLSGGQLDISRVGKLSANDRELISAQRKMLDEDDQTAHLLAVQYQMKAMNEEIQSIRLKLANLEASKAVAVDKEPLVSADAGDLILKLLAGLAALGLTLFGIYHYLEMKARSPKPAKLESEPTPAPAKAVGESTVTIYHPAGSRQHQANKALQESAEMPLEAPIASDSTNKEEQTVLEEAELYAVYGHPEKATRILLEFLFQFPKSENAWMLLLSIYSSNAQIPEFEKAARKFLNHNKNSPHWKTIQALGRTLDHDNYLYVEESPEKGALWLPSNMTKHRPIGDVLIELGYLSAQDMANCLGEFDPKQHGRFGNYLLTRRMINHSQLNEALLRQQSDEGSEVETDEAADWLPEDSTPNEIVEHHTSAVSEHVQDKAFPIDFVIDDKPKFSDEAAAVEALPAEKIATPAVEDKSQPLSFHIDFEPIANEQPKEK